MQNVFRVIKGANRSYITFCHLLNLVSHSQMVLQSKYHIPAKYP